MNDRDLATAARIVQAMRRVGMTQAELAFDTQMTEDKLSKSLHGKRRFSSFELALISELTGAPVEELLGMKIKIYSGNLTEAEIELRDAIIRRGERERCEAILEAIAREYEDHDGYANRDPRGWPIGETIRNSWKRLSGPQPADNPPIPDAKGDPEGWVRGQEEKP